MKLCGFKGRIRKTLFRGFCAFVDSTIIIRLWPLADIDLTVISRYIKADDVQKDLTCIDHS